MTPIKDEALSTARIEALRYKAIQEELATQRATLVESIQQAKAAGATQLEIAMETTFSRQRIAQFLQEQDLQAAHPRFDI